jgi:hypothetical protein
MPGFNIGVRRLVTDALTITDQTCCEVAVGEIAPDDTVATHL